MAPFVFLQVLGLEIRVHDDVPAQRDAAADLFGIVNPDIPVVLPIPGAIKQNQDFPKKILGKLPKI